VTRRRWVLDTNVYIDAIRNETARAQLAEWQRRNAPFVHQHTVVIGEILVCARDTPTWARWHERWVAPAERIGRIITPDYRTWLRASRIVARLSEQRHVQPGSLARGFFNDCLLAASAREHGFAIVTWNVADYELIRRVEPELDYSAPLP
jgi:predicted nucleic acid-binding protein